MLKRLIGWASVGLVAIGCTLYVATTVAAEPLRSSHYQFDESTIGAGGLEQSSSASFQANSALSDLAVGNEASANYQGEAGSKTTGDPALSFAITDANSSFGNFSAASAAVTSATFSISNYTSYGYVVQIVGTPPTNGSHTIAPMTTTSASQAGIDQFGINLVANTSPVSIGANPNNGQFGFGTAALNYGVSNKYRYVSGETIASAPKSSGVTIYTLSYLVNVASLTPGGQYTSNQTIIVTGTY